MSYTPNLNDRNSEYYYGPDSTYKFAPSKPKPQKRPAVRSPLLIDDPELQGYGDLSVPRVPGQSSAARPGQGRMANLGEKYKQQEIDAGKKAEDFRPGAGLPGQQATGRAAAAPDGSGAKGTQTSPRQMTMDEANSLLSDGYKVVNPFSNTQLPDTSGSPYFGKADTPEYRSDAPADFYDGELASDLTTGSPFKQGDYTYEVPTNTNIEYLQTSGAPLIQTGGAVQASETTTEAEKQKYAKPPRRPRGERAGEMWDRKYGRMNQQPEPTESKGSGIDYKRRAAFFSGENVMQGMRNMDSMYGFKYAGGQYNMVNPNQGQEGEPDFVKMDKQDYRDFKNGKIKAEELKNRYMDRVGKSTDEPADAFTSPPNYTMTPGVDVKTAESQRPPIEVDTSKLSEPVEYESPSVKFKGSRDKYKK